MNIYCYPEEELTKDRPDPEFLMVNRDYIYMDGGCYVRTGNRRAVPGKLYLIMNEHHLVRVTGITESEGSVTEFGVEDAEDTVSFEYLYDIVGGLGPSKAKNGEMKRYQLETEQALSMGDLASTPFEEFDPDCASPLG